MFCIGGVGALGYLDGLSKFLYAGLGSTSANIIIGILSAIVDNIPLTFAVLTMHPAMNLGQWLLLTLTAGIGGSLLSIGSAAGVALMGLGRETYTFTSHLKWSWAILLGFAAGVISFGMEREMMAAGISQLISEGRKSAKKSLNGTMPLCQIMSVVMSPKGENAPPALAATTILTSAPTVAFLLCPTVAMATVPMTSAVVRLSARGERKNAIAPTVQ